MPSTNYWSDLETSFNVNQTSGNDDVATMMARDQATRIDKKVTKITGDLFTAYIYVQSVRREMKYLQWDTQTVARRVISRATKEMEQEAKSYAPIKTGNLRNHIQQMTLQKVGTSYVKGGVIADTDYAATIEKSDRYMRKALNKVSARLDIITKEEWRRMGYYKGLPVKRMGKQLGRTVVRTVVKEAAQEVLMKAAISYRMR